MSTANNKEYLVTADHIREQLSYSPETGEFRWIVPARCRRLYMQAGCTRSDGYRVIGITINKKNILLQAHRLAWLYVYGVWPKFGLDHIDRNPSNNRISNLREATQQENLRNRRKAFNCSSRYLGVSWDKIRKKWTTRIKIVNKYKHIGRFDSETDAALAYNKAALERDPNFHNLNVVIQPKSA
jgi:HNH endonuclease/AP2 domain